MNNFQLVQTIGDARQTLVEAAIEWRMGGERSTDGLRTAVDVLIPLERARMQRLRVAFQVPTEADVETAFDWGALRHLRAASP